MSKTLDVKVPSLNFAVKTGIVIGAGLIALKVMPITWRAKIRSIFS